MAVYCAGFHHAMWWYNGRYLSPRDGSFCIVRTSQRQLKTLKIYSTLWRQNHCPHQTINLFVLVERLEKCRKPRPLVVRTSTAGKAAPCVQLLWLVYDGHFRPFGKVKARKQTCLSSWWWTATQHWSGLSHRYDITTGGTDILCVMHHPIRHIVLCPDQSQTTIYQQIRCLLVRLNGI